SEVLVALRLRGRGFGEPRDVLQLARRAIGVERPRRCAAPSSLAQRCGGGDEATRPPSRRRHVAPRVVESLSPREIARGPAGARPARRSGLSDQPPPVEAVIDPAALTVAFMFAAACKTSGPIVATHATPWVPS